MFAVNGITFASLVPRYPQIKEQLAASKTLWGLAIGIGPLGGLALGLAASTLMRRFGSRNVAVWPQLASTACLLLMANAPHIAWVFVAMITMSAFDAITDTSMNYQGLRVQEMYGRSIINTFHGWWSVGAVVGGLIGSAMAQWDVDINGQTIVTLVILAGFCALAWSLMLPGVDGAESSVAEEAVDRDPHANAVVPVGVGGDDGVDTGVGTGANTGVRTGGRVRVPGSLWVRAIALGVIGSLAGGIEIGGATWAPLYLSSSFRTTPFVAGLGFVLLMGAETLGRLVGDAIVNRVGVMATVAQGALVCLVGTGLSVAWPTTITALIGFTAAGWGVATMIPLAMHAADSLPGMRAGDGLTVATWVMRLGFMLYPMAIGALGDAVTLRWALASLPVGAVAILLLMPAFRMPGRAPSSHHASTPD